MIQIKNLSKSYGMNKVLDNINITFDKGKICGIVGVNGSGKTTLFRCIAGLESYYGEVVSERSPLKDYMGFLFTEPYFFSKITGEEYIRLLCNARDVKVPDLIEKNIFDLDLNQYAATYSTGEKKKLALLAILLQDNQCFILDEPFNGIDIHSSILLVDIIKAIGKKGKSVIISSHIFSTLSSVCDEIYLLEDSHIIRKVLKEDFDKLEDEMKEFAIGDKIKRLGL